MSFLLIKICGRNFVIDKNENLVYRNFIVNEFNLKLKENDSLILNKEVYEVSSGIFTPVKCKITVIKQLKKHIIRFTKNRRKRHTRTRGYVQSVVYIKPEVLKD